MAGRVRVHDKILGRVPGAKCVRSQYSRKR